VGRGEKNKRLSFSFFSKNARSIGKAREVPASAFDVSTSVFRLMEALLSHSVGRSTSIRIARQKERALEVGDGEKARSLLLWEKGRLQSIEPPFVDTFPLSLLLYSSLPPSPPPPTATARRARGPPGAALLLRRGRWTSGGPNDEGEAPSCFLFFFFFFLFFFSSLSCVFLRSSLFLRFTCSSSPFFSMLSIARGSRAPAALPLASALSRACSARSLGLEQGDSRSQSRPYASKFGGDDDAETKKPIPSSSSKELAALVANLLRSSPETAAASLSSRLTPAERRHLIAALSGAELRQGATDVVVETGGGVGGAEEEASTSTSSTFTSTSTSFSSSSPPSLPLAAPSFPKPPSSYVDAIFEQSDTHQPKGTLDRRELSAALRTHDAAALAAAASAASPLTPKTLSRIALAVGLPFVGFGFVDNFVMLLAGEEIEAVFGARFGLSTLAAAGLGNLVSDVAGLGLADQIEEKSRRTKIGAPVVLSPVDARRGVVRVARVAGSVVGVSVGCLLGLVPLLWF